VWWLCQQTHLDHMSVVKYLSMFDFKRQPGMNHTVESQPVDSRRRQIYANLSPVTNSPHAIAFTALTWFYLQLWKPHGPTDLLLNFDTLSSRTGAENLFDQLNIPVPVRARLQNPITNLHVCLLSPLGSIRHGSSRY
jgi:hypothetical protein